MIKTKLHRFQWDKMECIVSWKMLKSPKLELPSDMAESWAPKTYWRPIFSFLLSLFFPPCKLHSQVISPNPQHVTLFSALGYLKRPWIEHLYNNLLLAKFQSFSHSASNFCHIGMYWLDCPLLDPFPLWQGNFPATPPSMTFQGPAADCPTAWKWK